MISDITDIVDIDRYPVSDIGTPAARAFVREGRRRLAADGVFALPGFIRPAALSAMQEEADVIGLDTQPGTLTLFNGFRSLHRIAPVEAAPSRLMLVLSYDSAPGQVFSDEIHLRFFGRRQPVAGRAG